MKFLLEMERQENLSMFCRNLIKVGIKMFWNQHFQNLMKEMFTVWEHLIWHWKLCEKELKNWEILSNNWTKGKVVQLVFNENIVSLEVLKNWKNLSVTHNYTITKSMKWNRIWMTDNGDFDSVLGEKNRDHKINEG